METDNNKPVKSEIEIENEKLIKSEKLKERIRFIKFTAFSASAGAIQFGSSTLLYEVAGLPEWLAYLIGLVLSVIYNFTINRRFTFRSVTNYKLGMLKVFCYYAVFTPLSLWWFDALIDFGWNFYIVQIGTMLINFITEFLFCKFVVYKNSIDNRISSNNIDKTP